MQKFIVILLAIFGIFAAAQAGEKVTYVANMSGIDCTGCKKTIAKSIGKLKGVKTIRIEKKSANSHRLIVITDGSRPISMSDAKKALGKNVDHYQITSWSKG